MMFGDQRFQTLLSNAFKEYLNQDGSAKSVEAFINHASINFESDSLNKQFKMGSDEAKLGPRNTHFKADISLHVSTIHWSGPQVFDFVGQV